MLINHVAKLSGVTVRTLRYYDEIGLLTPGETTAAGYRVYDDSALRKLQQILFFRELEFSLDEIGRIISAPDFDQAVALTKHRELLLKKRQRLDRLLTLVEQTIEGENTMSFKEFDNSEIEGIKAQYSAEVKARWGGTDAFAQSEKKTDSYKKEDWQLLWNDGNTILKAFADLRGQPPQSEAVQSLVKQWQSFITESFYTCTDEILQGLGEMYMADERFKENIDKQGEGTAELLSQAIAVYCAD